jgi:hypothetical protein
MKAPSWGSILESSSSVISEMSSVECAADQGVGRRKWNGLASAVHGLVRDRRMTRGSIAIVRQDPAGHLAWARMNGEKMVELVAGRRLDSMMMVRRRAVRPISGLRHGQSAMTSSLYDVCYRNVSW